jgi:hypothetical protein
MKDGELLGHKDFDLLDTMSGFELMDKKMDCRFHFKDGLTPTKMTELGIFDFKKSLSSDDVLAIVEEYLI